MKVNIKVSFSIYKLLSLSPSHLLCTISDPMGESMNKPTGSVRRKMKTKINIECDKLVEIYITISYRSKSSQAHRTSPWHG